MVKSPVPSQSSRHSKAHKRKPARHTRTFIGPVSRTGSHNLASVELKASKSRPLAAGDVGLHHTSCRQKLWHSPTIFVHLRQTPSIGLFFAVDAIVCHRLPKNDGVEGGARRVSRNQRSRAQSRKKCRCFGTSKLPPPEGSFLSSARKAVSPSPPPPNRPSGERRSRLAARPPRKRRGTRP